MKRFFSCVLAALMLATLLSVSLTASAEQAYLQLTGANVAEYSLEPGLDPIPTHPLLQAETWNIGTMSYNPADGAFINMPLPNTAGWLRWDVSSVSYTDFKCYFGKGWAYAEGAACALTVKAVDANGTETQIAVSDFVAFGQDVVELKGAVPAGTVSIVASLMSENGDHTLNSCFIIGAVVYNAAEGDPKIVEGPASVDDVTLAPPLTAPVVTDAPDTDAPGTDAQGTEAQGTEQPAKKGGCGSAISAGALVLAVVVAAPIALKKKH